MPQAYLEVGCVRFSLHRAIIRAHGLPRRPHSTGRAPEHGQGRDVAGRALREPWLCFSGVQRQPLHTEERGGGQR